MDTARYHRGAALLVLALSVVPALAQTTVTETEGAAPNAVITDDFYIGGNDGNDGTGTDAGMTCADLDFSGSEIISVSDVTMDLSLSHDWIGDLVVKVQSPSGTVLAPLNRPGYTGPDDGTGGVGDSANLSSADSIRFADGAPKTAESMGDESTLSSYVVCTNFPNNCDYSPSPDGASNSAADFSGFDGEDPAGMWEVCVGDAAPIDQGVFAAVALTITGETEPPPPTCPVDFSATVNTTSLPSSGGQIVFSVSGTNTGSNTLSGELWLDATGPLNYTRLLLRGTLPPGGTFSRDINLNVPAAVPDGSYTVDLNVGDFETDNVCTSETFVLTKGGELLAARAMTKAEAEVRDRAPAAQSQGTVLFTDVVVEGGHPGDGFVAAEAVTTAPAEASVEASPNPFAGETALRFTLEEASEVRLAVYDLLGREVALLADGVLEAGAHTAVFQARGLAAGTYVYRLVVNNQVQTGRLTLAH